jgi:N-acetylmuramic acid 6-phosphate (MurNAc-6-P) etherase
VCTQQQPTRTPYQLACCSHLLLARLRTQECPPTYGASLTDVSGFVHGGWSTMENVEGDVSLLPREAAEAHTLQLSIDWFVREVVPQLGAVDVVAVLQIGAASDVAVQAAAAAAAERGARVATIRIEQAGAAPVLANCAANDVQIWLPCLRQRSLEAWLRRLSAQGAAGPVAAAALCELSPSAAELALKVAVNAVSTCAHVRNGTVFSNCMINLTISNIKLFHRAAALVSRLGGVELERSQRFLLRAIYGDDEGQTVSVDAVAQHVTRASTVEQVLPVSLILAIRSRSSGASGASNISVAEARALVSEQPVLRTILQNS